MKFSAPWHGSLLPSQLPSKHRKAPAPSLAAADPLPPPPSLRSAAISSMFMTPALAPVVRRSFGRLLAANVSMSIAFASVIYRFRRPPFLSLLLLFLARPHLDVSITRFRRSHSTPVPALVLHLCNAHRIALSLTLEKQNLSYFVCISRLPPSFIRRFFSRPPPLPAAILWWHAYNQDAASSRLSEIFFPSSSKSGPPPPLSSPLRRPSTLLVRPARSAYFKQ